MIDIRVYSLLMVINNFMVISTENTEIVNALIIGDPHFKVSNVRETDAMVEAIVRTVNERHPDIIVVLGDILDRHEVIHVSPLTRAIKFLKRLSEIAPTYVLIGNHDLKNNRQFLSDEHPFFALKFWGPNMIIVDTTTLVNIKGHTFTFVPYVPPGRFEEALNMCPGWENSTCIFAHQEFRGAQMGAIISTEGDNWPLTNTYVISGHIHDYQEPQVNILYTGTPIQHAFGDRHDKTISYFTYNSSTERNHERIDLGLPRKHIIRLTCAEVSTYVPQPNCELKIIIRGTSGEIKAIMKHPNIDTWKRCGYKIAYKDIPLDKVAIINDNNGNESIPQIVQSKAPLRFSMVLYNAVSSNPRLGPLYNRIFGSIRVPLELCCKPRESQTENQVVPENRDRLLTLKINQVVSGMSNLTLTTPSTPLPICKVATACEQSRSGVQGQVDQSLINKRIQAVVPTFSLKTPLVLSTK